MGKDKEQTVEERVDPATQQFRDEFLRPMAQSGARDIRNQERFTAGLGPAFQEGLESLRGVQGGIGDFLSRAGGEAPSVSAGSVGDFGFEAGTFDPARHEQFLNPFTEEVIQAQQGTFDRQRQQAIDMAAQEATQAGAFGGSRSGILQAEALGGVNRNEANQIAELRRQGFSEAMANALGTFGTEQNLALQEAQGQQRGDIANQQARLQAGIANQQAANQRLGLGLQGLGLGADIGQQFLGAGQVQQQVGTQRLRDPILRAQSAQAIGQGGIGPTGRDTTQRQEGDLFGDLLSAGTTAAGFAKGGPAGAAATGGGGSVAGKNQGQLNRQIGGGAGASGKGF